MEQIELESDKIVQEIMDEQCELDYTSNEVDELCDEASPQRSRFRDRLKGIIRRTVQVVRGSSSSTSVDTTEDWSAGELLEKGWEDRANASPLVRQAEVWKFALKSALAVLNARKLKLKVGVTDQELQQAQTKAAEYIRDGLLKLG